MGKHRHINTTYYIWSLTLVVMKLTHLPQVIPSTCTLATPRLPPGPGRAMAGLSTEAENLAGLQLVIWSATEDTSR